MLQKEGGVVMSKLRVDIFYLVYGLIGGLLLMGLLLSTPKGLPDVNYDLYVTAKSISPVVGKEVWKGLRLSDYPVAIRQGNTEYVFYEGKTTRRKAVLPLIAATAYELDGLMNVLIPCYHELGNLSELAEGMNNEGDMMKNSFGFNEDTLKEEEYLAVMYHETFHAYQFTHHRELLALGEKTKRFDIEYMSQLEQDEELSSYYEKEGRLLHEALTASSTRVCLQKAMYYVDLRHKREVYLQAKLGEYEKVSDWEVFYELVEGTASYVQMRVLDLLGDTESYQEAIDSVHKLGDGRHKYYESGMAMSMIMDRLGIEWQEGIFQSGKPMFQQFQDQINMLMDSVDD